MGALTNEGFKRPIYSEILSGQISKAKELFGEDIETDEKTPLGKFIRITAYDLTNAYEDLETCYYARFPNTASGTSLDRLCVFAGISRNPATAAKYNVKITGTKGHTIASEFLVGTNSGVTFYIEDPVRIPEEGYVTVPVICTELGEIGNVSQNAICRVMNPDAYVTKVEQIEQTQRAQDEESDADLRKRFAVAISGAGSSTVSAIRAEIMRVTNVKNCNVVENETDETDIFGIPPHSFECFVTASDDLNQKIAEAIFRKKPVGIRSYGTTTKTVTADDGTAHTIRFTKTAEKNFYVVMTIETDITFPSNGKELIKQNLVDYIASFKAGEDVLAAAMYGYVFKVEGIKNVSAIVLKLNPQDTGTARINTTYSEVAALKPENITITVNSYEDK